LGKKIAELQETINAFENPLNMSSEKLKEIVEAQLYKNFCRAEIEKIHSDSNFKLTDEQRNAEVQKIAN